MLAAIGLASLCVLGSGCGGSGGGSATFTRTDSAGVAIVRNVDADRPLAWTLKPLFTVGGAESGPESFFQVAGLGADSAGDLYVLDEGNKRVVVFGPKGDLVRTEGEAGQGPGELSMPFSITVRPDGSVPGLRRALPGVHRLRPVGRAAPLPAPVHLPVGSPDGDANGVRGRVPGRDAA